MTETDGPTKEKFPGNTDAASLGINSDMKKWLPGERKLDPEGTKKISIGGGGQGGRDFLKDSWCFYKCYMYKKQLNSIADVGLLSGQSYITVQKKLFFLEKLTFIWV